MKLTIFQSDKGDCLLLESSDGKCILVDGGMAGSYREHVATTLGDLRGAGRPLDLVYVSHIDEDHIEGILTLMDAELDWRVHEFQIATGNDRHQPPRKPRPPEVRELWHNGFSDLIGRNSKPITDLLAQTAAVLEFGSCVDDRERAARHRDLETSVNQGRRLSRRVGAAQLKIPLNRAFDGKLALVRDGQQPIRLGSLTTTVIGPFEADLQALRDEWNDWLRKNHTQLTKMRAQMRSDIDRLGTGEVGQFRAASKLQAAELGDRSEVTAPNLASLMLLVEEGGKSVLLTGDGHEDDILEGLSRASRLDAQGGIHVDILKVPHHGSEFNLSAKLAGRVVADHYIFCSDGAHHNPDVRVLNAIFDARLAPARGRPFKLWFNSSPAAAPAGERREQMTTVRALVEERIRRHPGAFSFEFLDDHFLEIAL